LADKCVGRRILDWGIPAFVTFLYRRTGRLTSAKALERAWKEAELAPQIAAKPSMQGAYANGAINICAVTQPGLGGVAASRHTEPNR
jgi:hypothetical protein